ncbi:helicase-exonuclease AddAB subunit AddA [Alkalicoccus luteus]|uniref:ATP-dependent helicase/nuclease subunit A n=1 Tax=Alkalicoccus luteus TaxID=1237094 RepID=A0A969PN95_9BACI|nr:helicase-exonuclease AddAB subunit AddA [Alkalicoccus luteus]NJP37316.1 helicase-exonuclease AddAB subunit AddA [Alkalicoccus luteus]
MTAKKWTASQQQAIDQREGPILVAAAAGSGKTAVLVERIIQQLVNGELEITDILVVTFTNAAAAEMRQRISKGLENELKKRPNSPLLRRQLNLLPRASISTLHAFCKSVLQTYYYEAGVDPRFRLLDQTEAQLTEDEVMEELFEDAYRDDDRFYRLVDYFTGDKDDEALKRLILDLYHFSRANPYPEQWLTNMVDVYRSDSGNPEWLDDARQFVKDRFQSLHGLYERMMVLCRDEDGPRAYLPVLEEEAAAIDRILAAADRESMRLLASPSFKRLPAVKKADKELLDADKQNVVKSGRDTVKDEWKKIYEQFLKEETEFVLDDMAAAGPLLELLAEYTESFAERYEARKRSVNVLDFHDLEHYCLKLFGEETDAVRSYQRRFKEVLVDEYQDTNFVQEELLLRIASADSMFMVGDVKQSIYRFRLAEPGLFLSKFHRYEKEGAGTRIDLAANFRSRHEILGAVNDLFRKLMSERLGELDYDERSFLRQGSADQLNLDQMEPELVMCSREGDGDEEDAEAARLEARAAAVKIRRMIDSGFMIADKELGVQRPIRYSDIAVLMRSMPWAETYVEEFSLYNVPLYADLSTGYFDAVEIRVMLSLLQIIDNPYQDIPLASVLRSPIGGLDEEELALIRGCYPEGSFFTALKIYAGRYTDSRAASFITELKNWRSDAVEKSLASFIWQLYNDTGYLEYCGGLPGGRQRRANLTALYDRAVQYEATSFRGLFRFLRFIERMKERGEDLGKAGAAGESEDVVRLMTVHKSKGLEFPVVILAGLNKGFNFQDLNQAYLKHKEMGLAVRLIDPERRTSYPTLFYYVMREKLRREQLAEEMRVLYVSMTRAEQKLICTLSVNDTEKAVDAWKMSVEGSRVSEASLLRSGSPADWLVPVLMTYRDNLTQFAPEAPLHEAESGTRWIISVESVQTLPAPETENGDEERKKLLQYVRKLEPFAEPEKAIQDLLEWQYSHTAAVRTPVKHSVTELKRMQEPDPYARRITGDVQELVEKPSFASAEKRSGADTGTAVHTVMQFIHYADFDKDSIKREIERLVQEEKLTKAEADAVPPEWIERFFNSDTGLSLKKAKHVYRELPFNISIPASTFYPDWTGPEENLFIQGIIDCVYQNENGEWVILDYKTDRAHDAESLRERYRFQLKMYQQALEEAWGLNRTEAVIIAMRTGERIRLEDK